VALLLLCCLYLLHRKYRKKRISEADTDDSERTEGGVGASAAGYAPALHAPRVPAPVAVPSGMGRFSLKTPRHSRPANWGTAERSDRMSSEDEAAADDELRMIDELQGKRSRALALPRGEWIGEDGTRISRI